MESRYRRNPVLYSMHAYVPGRYSDCLHSDGDTLSTSLCFFESYRANGIHCGRREHSLASLRKCLNDDVNKVRSQEVGSREPVTQFHREGPHCFQRVHDVLRRGRLARSRTADGICVRNARNRESRCCKQPRSETGLRLMPDDAGGERRDPIGQNK
jgi:hypothetical protein